MRLYMVVEGPSENSFARNVLAPHLETFGMQVITLVVESSRETSGKKFRGGGQWKHWQSDLRRLTGQQKGRDVRFTTMIDLYGLPKNFPGLAEHGSDQNTLRRVQELEKKMAEAVGDYRFIPNIQRHEFEALVLAALDELALLLDSPEELVALAALKEKVELSAPEEINDSPETAPSKQLKQRIPSYQKTGHGPQALKLAGLEKIRSQCPRFSAWISTLEALGEKDS